MGFMFRVRLSSFFAGAAAASVGGFYYLYKDYMLAQQAISQQVFDTMLLHADHKLCVRQCMLILKRSSKVRENYESLEGRYEALSARVAALENSKIVGTATPAEGSE